MPALIALSYASLLILGLMDNVRGPFFPEILADLNLNGTKGSVFFAATSLLAFVGSWSSHRLVVRRSAKTLLVLSCVFLSVGFFWIASCHDLSSLLLACAFFGFAFGALNLAQNLMVFEASPRHLRRRFFSGLHSMYGLAALLAPAVSSLFHWVELGWRQCFYFLSAGPVIVSLVGWKMAASAPSAAQVAPSPVPLTARDWRRLFIFGLMMAGYLWGEISISTRMVLWLRVEHNFSPFLANLYLGGFFLTLLAGRLTFGLMHFQRLSNWAVLCISVTLSALTYGLTLHHSPLWGVAAGLVMAPFFPVAMEQVSVSFGQNSAQALGFILGFGSLSVVLMHMTFGYLSDILGVQAAMHIGPYSQATVAAILWLWSLTKKDVWKPQ